MLHLAPPSYHQNTGMRHTPLTRGALAYAIAQHALEYPEKTLLILSQDPLLSEQLLYELPFFHPKIPLYAFPDWETLPYEQFSPHESIISERLKTLCILEKKEPAVICMPMTTALHKLCPKHHIQQHALQYQIGDVLDLPKLRAALLSYGYQSTAQVITHGQFAIRGSLVDLFPMGSPHPYRLDLFDTDIESIRVFDPETQRSVSPVKSLDLLPAHEFPMDEISIKTFRHRWRECFSGNPTDCPVYQDISAQKITPGIEYYIPLFFEQMASIFDYLPQDTLILTVGAIHATAEQFIQEAKTRFKTHGVDPHRPFLPVQDLFLSVDECFGKIKHYPVIEIPSETLGSESPYALPSLTIDERAEQPLHRLTTWCAQHPMQRVLLTAESPGRLEMIQTLLQKHGLWPKPYTCFSDFIDDPVALGLTIAPLETGFTDPDRQMTVIPEHALYGMKVQQRRRRAPQKYTPSEHIVRNLLELQVGQYVVHAEHGIARYLGLEIIRVHHIDGEYLTLEYANHAKLYVPVASIELISKYTQCSSTTESFSLHTLGSTQWEKTKQKAAERVRDSAAELLEIYAKRQASQGFQYQIPEKEYAQFCTEFPFEETHDQRAAIEAVLSDMQQSTTMDRLICGDVGFGKTEVALRAACIAVLNHKQVALLVPTTLLAQQHYETFVDRFSQFPVRVEVLSRFKSASTQKIIIEKLKQGQVDIIIGTHRLLQKDIAFQNLGLVLIDEEHRFGVHQKEQLKKLRSTVDILTLTATPIPRTLNLSLAGIRDLSIIATPPQKRRSIKTLIQERSPAVIQEAISRELKRGGQVYFLHNDIATIDKTAQETQALFPEAKIAIAHGQMRERLLEQIMSDFYHRRYHILICTTIIETGIDIPSANTILMDKAHTFGLAQLHQLRGRVGRSHHQAYAYLFTPPQSLLSTEASLRLKAISESEALGAGFHLATQDMEIRGTGHFLGEEQSGYMESIGYELYMDLLQQAVSDLKQGIAPSPDPLQSCLTEIELQIPCLLPDDYLLDVNQRLVFYKRIAACKTPVELEALRSELIDRFGAIPPQTQNLLWVAKLKQKASALKIAKIDAGSTGGKIKFRPHPNINVTRLIGLIQTEPKRYKLHQQDTLYFYTATPDPQLRIQMISDILESLTPQEAQ